MAFSHVIGTYKIGAAGGATTTGIDTTGADFIVIGVAWYDAVTATPTVSDSKGNTWTALTLSSMSLGDGSERLYYCKNPTVGSGHTFSVSGTSIYSPIFVNCFSGGSAAELDQQNTFDYTAGFTSVQPGSLTPAADDSLIITGIHIYSNSSAYGINGGFTAQVQPWSTPVTQGGGMAYLIQTTATPVNPTWSWTTNSFAALSMAVFRPSAAVSGGGPLMLSGNKRSNKFGKCGGRSA